MADYNNPGSLFNTLYPQGGNGWANVNGMNVPIFSNTDFEWKANETYDPNAGKYQTVWRSNGGDTGSDWQDTIVNPNSVRGNWDLSEAGRNRLVAGGWDPKNRNNIGFNMGSQGGEWGVGQGGMNLAGFDDPNVNPYDKIVQAGYKNSNSTGLNYKYVKDANGNMVPQADRGMNWGTNSGDINREALAAFALVGGAGALGAAGAFGAMPAAAGEGAAVGGAAAGTTAADTSLGVGSTVLGDLTPAAGTMGYGATPGIEGTIAGTTAGTGAGTTSIMGDVGPAGVQPGYGPIEQPWYQTAYDYAKTANEYKGYYDKAKTAYNMMNPPEQSFQHYNEGYDDLSGSPSGGGYTPDPNQSEPGGSSAGMPSWTSPQGGAGWDRYAKVGGSLADMAAAYYSAQQQKDLSGNQKAPFSAMQGKQDEYNKLLMASYYNPDTFYNSNQWKGLSSIYGNKLDRNAGNIGRLANDSDRAVMMQKYGMNELENYRTGLRGNINAYDPSRLAGMYGEGLKSEAGANTAPFAAASKGGPTANEVQGYVNTAKSAYEIWQGVSKWFA